MPTQRQLTMIDTIELTVSEKGSSDTARLKDAYGTHVDSIVKSLPATKIKIGEGDAEKPVTLHRDSLRAAYEMFIKSDHDNSKYTKGSYWPEAGEKAASMSYTNAPKIGTIAPEGEALPGSPGSTIVASGLGPNVNIHGTLGAAGTRANIDGSTPPSSAKIDTHHDLDGQASPHNTSTRMANETSIPPGTLGHSLSSPDGTI